MKQPLAILLLAGIVIGCYSLAGSLEPARSASQVGRFQLVQARITEYAASQSPTIKETPIRIDTATGKTWEFTSSNSNVYVYGWFEIPEHDKKTQSDK